MGADAAHGKDASTEVGSVDLPLRLVGCRLLLGARCRRPLSLTHIYELPAEVDLFFEQLYVASNIPSYALTKPESSEI